VKTKVYLANTYACYYSNHRSSSTTSIHHISIYLESKNLCNASNHMLVRIQMHQSSLWACSLYLCLSFKILFFCHISPPCNILSLRLISPPLSLISTKGYVQILGRVSQIVINMGWIYEYHFHIWFNLDYLPKKFNSVWFNGKLLHTSCKGYLDNVLNTFSSFSRSNTRFTSPQTSYMLPLDHIKHRSNSGI
jgi:hypothetical protein